MSKAYVVFVNLNFSFFISIFKNLIYFLLKFQKSDSIFQPILLILSLLRFF